MMTSPWPVYLFRSAGFGPSGNTVVSVAPLDCVVAVYGNGGVIGEGGLSSTFGGAAVFKNDASGDYFVGVWGARNASRFRKELRTHMRIAVHKEAPDARLSFWGAEKERPKPVRK
ncbi:hypothetical protein B5M44_15720 [Shinella sumterensis]|uniref:hypothetical protein n=1 Tax=Shinella sumterensis TaxID=1967501 RepID=UPI00106F1CAD|nr:hypothetical protein [Shinella sumterensis]TFE97253.1 hypothetical protein B5M44_15720 [Shinella sumterensis]